MELLQTQMDEGGFANLTVTGCSMHPLLRARRDSVVLVPITQKPRKGDIILYRRANGQYVLHRIVAMENSRYICCGDNQTMKEPVTQSQILAVVSAFTRRGKTCSVNHPGYRVYVWMWVELFCLRKYYLFVRRRCARLFKAVFHRTGNKHI